MKGRKTGNPLREPSKQVVSTGEVAKRFGMSRDWALKLLRRWYREQQNGGEVRVFRTPGSGGQHFATTLAVLQRYAPAARDEYLYREVRRLNADLDVAAGRIDRLMSERDALEKRVRKLEDALARLPVRRAV